MTLEAGSRESSPLDSLNRMGMRAVYNCMDDVRKSEVAKTPAGAEALKNLEAEMRKGRPKTENVAAAFKVLRPDQEFSRGGFFPKSESAE
jgi:hypothetical protein